MGTVIVLAVLAAIVGLIVRSMIRDKKNGKSLHCGGNCSGCGCHCSGEIRKTGK
ncbi:MAG TPA: FeoB-associated Cys-rich membrane protein [Candidatus Blautia intestinipullorum]|nr:FeoB-associated Cys-rich membrane protein [Candidatus Blautia intestinipullorum]